MKHQPGCNPFIGYLKTQRQTCLAIKTNQKGNIKLNQVYHKTCDGNPIERWAWINGAHIYNNHQKSCLTVSSYSNWNFATFYDNSTDLFLELTDYNPKNKNQQWKRDKSTGVISILISSVSMCLSDNPKSTLRFPNSVETPVNLDYNIIGGSNCISWFLIPVTDVDGNRQVCDDF